MYIQMRFENINNFPIPPIRQSSLEHEFQVISHPEGRIRLGFDFLHRHVIRNLDQREPLCEVDVKDTLLIERTESVQHDSILL